MNDRLVLREIAWKEVFPGLLLLRAFRFSIRPHLLVLTAVCIGLTSLGWNQWIGSLFDGSLQSTQQAVREATAWGSYLELLDYPDRLPKGQSSPWIGPGQMANAFLTIFGPQLSLSTFCFLTLAEIWGWLIWAFGAGLVTRLAVVEFARGEKLGLVRAGRYVVRHYPSYCGAILIPIVAMLLALSPLCVLGLLMRLGIGTMVAGLTWPLALILGFLASLLLVGLLLGWPFLLAAVSAEGTDSFDAVGRAYSYLSGGALWIVGYAVFAGILGGLGWLLVEGVADLTKQLAFWGVSWGAGAAHTATIMSRGAPDADLGGATKIGLGWIHAWNSGLDLLVSAYLTNFLLASASVVYLLVREIVDGKESVDVYLPDESAGQELPILPRDEQGVPVAPVEPAAKSSDDTGISGN